MALLAFAFAGLSSFQTDPPSPNIVAAYPVLWLETSLGEFLAALGWQSGINQYFCSTKQIPSLPCSGIRPSRPANWMHLHSHSASEEV